MNTTKILLFDGEAIILRGEKSLLESARDYVKTKLCVQQASEILKREHPDSLITHLIMPTKSIVEICRNIKVRYPNIETIHVSGSPDEIREHLLDFLRVEGSHISKPRLFNNKSSHEKTV